MSKSQEIAKLIFESTVPSYWNALTDMAYLVENLIDTQERRNLCMALLAEMLQAYALPPLVEEYGFINDTVFSTSVAVDLVRLAQRNPR